MPLKELLYKMEANELTKSEAIELQKILENKYKNAVNQNDIKLAIPLLEGIIRR